MPATKSQPELDAVETDRRRALGVVASVSLAASALVLPGCSRASDGNGAETDAGKSEVTANEDLMREHGVLRRILIVYSEVAPILARDPGSVDAGAITTAARLFRDFGEHYHEQILEEQHIFPLVRKAGGNGAALIDTLLAQHERGRAITDYILDRTKLGHIATGDGEALAKAMRGFTRMYQAHAAREDTVVFPAFKSSIGRRAYSELGEQFEEIEHKQFGGDGFDIALDKIAEVEAALGLQDLADFTAPAPSAG
ncbi:hemerythrin domain-containing protein [Stakelama marina]|uniref:Hemerythrin domain-containing protein n=1 Tax=Stakelama marina TaxID=2826939 RepID=A0A8T4IF72_9SPHN|nr:hemerythrin domain-containing protein [Stakelama marina]MBR0552712.1 hemerythrin domain-containing protein [Stakelama marina]